MSWRGTKQIFGRTPSLLLSLLLVVLFLGHDVFMATEAVATPSAIASAVPHGSAVHAAAGDSLAPHSQHPESEHPTDCGVGQTALPRSAHDLEQRVLGQAVVDLPPSSHAPAAVRTHGAVWQEPHWPPGTRRALFQVYRI